MAHLWPSFLAPGRVKHGGNGREPLQAQLLLVYDAVNLERAVGQVRAHLPSTNTREREREREREGERERESDEMR